MKKYQNLSRILSVLLVLAMALSCFGMTALAVAAPCGEAGCSGEYSNGICSADASHWEAAPIEGGVYRIGNAGQLFWFAALVNSGANEYAASNGQTYNAVLTADISIPGGMDWTPMGLYTSATEYIRYSGTFDGAGHTVSGLYYDNTAYTGRTVGFVGCLDSDGTVKDLTLANASINGATDVGGIVSHNYGTVSGCTVSGSVSGSGATGGIVCRNMDGGVVENCANSASVTGAITGGIAAENTAEISGCDNSGTVSGSNSVGGTVGMNSGAVEGSLNTASVTGTGTHVGGVVGNHVGGAITDCGNTGNVTGGSDYVGGVAGVCSAASITRSYNSGAVSGSGKSDAVGGVAGAIDGTNTAKSTITDCYNTGSVSGRSWVGGIAGVSGYQKTPQTVEIQGGYTTGAVSGTSYHGAVVGALNKGTVSGVYYLQGAQNSVSGATAATAAQFASGEMVGVLNGSGDAIWYQTLDLKGTQPDASPVLDPAHGTVYHGYKNCTEEGYTNRENYGVPGDHDFVDGICSVCGESDAVRAVNAATGAEYASVTAALKEAKSGETVRVMEDVSEGYILVAPGVTLDLNGMDLTAAYAVGFNTAHIIDSVGTGSLITGLQNLVLDQENGMVPVYNDGAYVFTKAGFAVKRNAAYQGEGVKIDAGAYPVNMDVVELLKNGGADNNLRVVMLLTWNTADGTGSQEFVFTDEVMSQVYSSNKGTWSKYGKMFSMTITGFDGIENLQARVALVSGTNATYISPNYVSIT